MTVYLVLMTIFVLDVLLALGALMDMHSLQAISVEKYRSIFRNESTTLPSQNIHGKQISSDEKEAPTSADRTVSSALSVIFIPSFQGTLLYDCADKSSCIPLFLSPLSPKTYRQTYDALQSSSTIAFRDLHYTVEYPSFTCPPSPFSHIGHCNALPALGAIHDFIANLNSSAPPLVVKVVPYDWRQSIRVLLSSSSKNSFSETLSAILRKQSKQSVIVAHGTACRLLAHFLNASNQISQVKAVICIAPAQSEDGAKALLNGTGLLTEPESAHVRADACVNVRDSSRLDFSQVDGELGLSRRRREAMQHVPGPWDVIDPKLVSSKGERISLARGFPAVMELAASGGLVPAILGLKNVVCVDAKREAHTNSLCEVMQHASSVIQSGAHKFDLVGLAADIVRKFAITNN